jgi:hypothetical protein
VVTRRTTILLSSSAKSTAKGQAQLAGAGRCLSHRDIVDQPRPSRPFQGWRYLTAKDAPRDIGRDAGDLGEMRRELAGLGLL